MTVQQASKTFAGARTDKPAIVQKASNPWMIGFIIVQIIIGYEWLVSGLVKVLRGDFTTGLADELVEKAEGAYGWYANLLESVIVPNASILGWIIETAEILIGIAFIVIPLLWVFAQQRVSERLWRTAFLLMTIAAIGGFFMALNFHLANGYAHPWIIPMDSFEEGVDFDTFLAAMNGVIAIVYINLYSRFRRQDN